MNRQLNLFERVEQAVIHQRELLDGYQTNPRARVGLFLDEWGVWDRMIPDEERTRGKLWMQSTMRSAVGAGLGLNVFNRQADKLYMCNIAQLMNVLQSVLLTDGPEGQQCIRTSTYWAFMLFKAHRGKTAVRVEADGNRLAPEGGRGGRGQGQVEAPPELSVSASRQGGQVVVSLVNPRHDVDMEVECAIRGATPRAARAEILHDPDMNACNTFDHPDRLHIQPHQAAVEGGNLKLTLPALSVVTVTVDAS
jgi:alpha-N-arabinofuranosidase